jgi:dTDP-4-dehydrorhamnose reductase
MDVGGSARPWIIRHLRRGVKVDIVRVLVTGAGGLVGGRLAALLAGPFQVVAGRHEAPSPEGVQSVPLDVLSEAAIEAALSDARPEAVVHAAAVADPDRCEREPERAAALNEGATRVLARHCRRRDIRLLSLSTDLVFPGDRAGWAETDPPAPLLVYGRSKLGGEAAALSEHPGSAVLRVALVCGRGHGPRATASESIAWALRAGRTVRLYTDQYRTPIDPESIASAVARLLPGSERGVFHLGGPERVSRYELGVRTARLLGLDPAGIKATLFADAAGAAPRPADVSLDSGRAQRELGWRPRGLDAAILDGRRSPDDEAAAPMRAS